MQPFRHGIGLLLGEYDPPIIPVFIQGTEQALPPERFLPRPSKIIVHFGQPIDAATLRDAAGEGGENQDQQTRITSVLEKTVARLRDEALAEH